MNLNNFFEKPSSVRFNGYCKEFEDFISTAYKRAITWGCVVAELTNPTAGNVEYFKNTLGYDFECSLDFFVRVLAKWVPQLNLQQRNLFAKSAYTVFCQLRDLGKNTSALNNYYVKLMCWVYYKFVNVLTHTGKGNIPVIIYTGGYGLYELRTVQILKMCGCSVVYLDTTCDEAAYKKYDPTGICTELHEFASAQKFPLNWKLKPVQVTQTPTRSTHKVIGERLKVDVSDSADFFHLNNDEIYRIQVNGVTTEYNNTLFEYKAMYGDAVFIEGDILPVRPDEILIKNKQFSTMQECLTCLETSTILPNQPMTFTYRLALRELIDKYKISSIQKCIALHYLCLRYKQLFSGGKLFILCSKLSLYSLFVLDMLTRFKTSIFVLNPSKSDLSVDGLHVLELESKSDLDRFPAHKTAVSTTTIASKAEGEIQSVLYSGELGIFKDHQFSKAKVSYLDCTYDEIGILWNEELRMRQGFTVENDVVTLPTICAKLVGIPEGDTAEYNDMLATIRSTAIYNIGPILNNFQVSIFSAQCMKNGEVSIEDICSNPRYGYSHLRSSVQHYLLDGIQELIDLKLIKDFGKHGVENVLFSVALNLPQPFLNAMQEFDFTKRNPKFINLRTSEEQVSLEDSILMSYLSVLGFDVVLVIPTGYNVFGKYVTQELFKSYEFGNYKYDFTITDVKQSFFRKLFGRR